MGEKNSQRMSSADELREMIRILRRKNENAEGPNIALTVAGKAVEFWWPWKTDYLALQPQDARRWAEALLHRATQCDGLKTEIVVCNGDPLSKGD